MSSARVSGHCHNETLVPALGATGTRGDRPPVSLSCYLWPLAWVADTSSAPCWALPSSVSPHLYSFSSLLGMDPIPATVGTVVGGDRSGSGQPRAGSLFPQSHKPEKEWPVRNLKVYLGVKKKLRPPTW